MISRFTRGTCNLDGKIPDQNWNEHVMKGGVCHRLSKWVMCLRLTMEHDYFKTTIPTVTVRPDNKRPFLLWEFFHALYLVSIEVFASCTPQMTIWSWANQKCLPPNFMRRQISIRALLKAQKVRVSLGRVARRFPVSAIFQLNLISLVLDELKYLRLDYFRF